MESAVLVLICLLCLLAIVGVVLLNLYLLWTTRKELKKQQAIIDDNRRTIRQMGDDVDVMLAKISSGVKYKVDSNAVSILDLAEFRDLDPYIKKAYRRHIVDVLTPAISDAFNRAFKAKDLKGFLETHDREISDAVYEMSQKIRREGITSVMP